jgi:hypothetical protein
VTLDDMTTVLSGLFAGESTPTLQGWVQEAYRRAATESKWLTKNLAVGTTVAGTADYPIASDVLQLESVVIDGAEYGRVNEFDILDVQHGRAFVDVPVFAQSFSGAGADQITLFPTPTTSGLAITGKAVMVPPDLVTGSGAGSAPVFTTDLHSVVLDGAIAIGYLRSDERPDMAGEHEQRFRDGVLRATRRRVKRASGHGPFRAALMGIDF